jgi:hypothetical protein
LLLPELNGDTALEAPAMRASKPTLRERIRTDIEPDRIPKMS